VGSLGALPGGAGGRRIRAGDDAASIATSLLSSASSLRGVHSKKSLTTLVERTARQAREHISRGLAGGAGADDGDNSAGIPEPRIVTVVDAPGAMAQKKALVSLLPYQHRNPAV
jgi:hypothetical protein